MFVLLCVDMFLCDQLKIGIVTVTDPTSRKRERQIERGLSILLF